MAYISQFNQELNLRTHRAPVSVWDRRGWDGTPERRALTRILVGVGGAALAVQGLRQRTWTGRMLAGLGGSLTWWALAGGGDLAQARHRLHEIRERMPGRREDRVLEASDESFPASDAPAWTTVGTKVGRTVNVP